MRIDCRDKVERNVRRRILDSKGVPSHNITDKEEGILSKHPVLEIDDRYYSKNRDKVDNALEEASQILEQEAERPQEDVGKVE